MGRQTNQINLSSQSSQPGYTGPGIKRPVGLILSSIALGFAAIVLLVIAALMAFVGVASTCTSPAPIPHFAVYACITASIVFAVLAVWAILTIIGILRLCSWARYSILVIGGGLAAIGVFGVFGSILSRTMLSSLPAGQPPIDPNIMTAFFLIMAAVYLLIAAVGVWWLIYFNLRSTRELFLAPSPSGINFPSYVAGSPRRPTAITVLACLFFCSTLCCGICALLPLPAFILGFILPVKASHLLYLAFAVIAAYIGYGFLKLQEAARLTAIAFLLLGVCQLALSCLPWYRAKILLYTTQLTAQFSIHPAQPQPLFPIGAMLVFNAIFGIVFNAVLLWLLHSHRAAFRPAAPPPPIETMLEA